MTCASEAVGIKVKMLSWCCFSVFELAEAFEFIMTFLPNSNPGLIRSFLFTEKYNTEKYRKVLNYNYNNQQVYTTKNGTYPIQQPGGVLEFWWVKPPHFAKLGCPFLGCLWGEIRGYSFRRRYQIGALSSSWIRLVGCLSDVGNTWAQVNWILMLHWT